MKEYRTMPSKERSEWLERFGQFLRNDYRLIKSMSDGWRQAFKRGLALLEWFTISERFVRDSRQFMDYERRVKRMCFFVEELRKQVVQTEGEVLARLASPQYKRRVGRPTAESLEEERRALAQQEEDRMKVEALATIAGTKVEVVDAKHLPEMKTGKKAADIPDLFAQGNDGGAEMESPDNGRDASAIQSPDNEQKTSGEALDTSERTAHLQDLKHLLSADLRERVENVAMLRGQAATESEMAKLLAEKGASSEEIGQHAKAAADYTDAYMRIYDDVDRELATLYIATRVDEKAVVQGESRDSQLSKTKPYYEKVKDANPMFEGKVLMALEKKEEQEVGLSPEGKPMSKAEKAALLHKYRNYFLAKNVKTTKNRLDKMKERIEYLKQLGEETAEYEVIYERAKKELE